MKLLRVQTTKHNPRVLDICHEHRQVYQAIVQRDTEKAINLICEHLLASKERVGKLLSDICT